MRKSAPFISALLWLTLGLVPCYAESAEALALAKILNAKGQDGTANDPRWRTSLAAAVQRYCESILVQVPRNTPQEDRWVDDEFKELGKLASSPVDPDTFFEHDQRWTRRWNRAWNSVEHARKTMRRIFSECSSTASALFGTKQASPAAEVLLWVRLARLFSAEDDLWRFANIVGLLSPQTGCQALHAAFTVEDLMKSPAVDVRDENNLCYVGRIQYSIIDHAVVPVLESLQ